MELTAAEQKVWLEAQKRQPRWEKWYGFMLRVSKTAFAEVCKFDGELGGGLAGDKLWGVAYGNGNQCKEFDTLSEALRFAEMWYHRRMLSQLKVRHFTTSYSGRQLVPA